MRKALEDYLIKLERRHDAVQTLRNLNADNKCRYNELNERLIGIKDTWTMIHFILKEY